MGHIDTGSAVQPPAIRPNGRGVKLPPDFGVLMRGFEYGKAIEV